VVSSPVTVSQSALVLHKLALVVMAALPHQVNHVSHGAHVPMWLLLYLLLHNGELS
jgi:hypothetical protein